MEMNENEIFEFAAQSWKLIRFVWTFVSAEDGFV